jgi:uncharacterized protein (DUF2236 family)
VVRSPDALFPPGSAIWRVHGDVTTMMIGGVTALLLQMLHPAARAETETLIASFRPELAVNARTREVAGLVLNQPAPSLAMAPVQTMLMHAAVDVLPRWAKEMHGLDLLPLSGPLVRTGAFTLAHTLRWAFRAR